MTFFSLVSINEPLFDLLIFQEPSTQLLGSIHISWQLGTHGLLFTTMVMLGYHLCAVLLKFLRKTNVLVFDIIEINWLSMYFDFTQCFWRCLLGVNLYPRNSNWDGQWEVLFIIWTDSYLTKNRERPSNPYFKGKSIPQKSKLERGPILQNLKNLIQNSFLHTNSKSFVK